MATSTEERIMRISTDQLWVVEYIRSDRYSLDTSMPEEVFTTRESADEFCAYLNNAPRKFSWEKPNPYSVFRLCDRLDELRDNLRESGASDERDNFSY